jgi:membrane protein
MAVYRRVLVESRRAYNGVIRQVEGWPLGAVLLDTVRHAGRHQVGDLAAGLAYYVLFALFPLLLAIIAVFSFFLDRETVQAELVSLLGQYMPRAEGIVDRNLDAVFRLRGPIGILSVLVLLWTGSNVFGALTRMLDRAWEVRDTHAFHIARVRSLAMVLAVLAVVLVSLFSATLLQFAEDLAALDPLGLGLGAFLASGARFLLGGSSLVGSILFPILLYRFVPSEQQPWPNILAGAALAGLLFEVAKNAFLLYLGNFANYDLVYGSLASVIILLFWVYISGFILILGAEFGAAVGRWRRGVKDAPGKRRKAAR